MKKIDNVSYENKKAKMNELEELSRPLSDFLYKYGTLYTSIIITTEGVRLMEDLIGIPFKNENIYKEG